MVEKVNNIIITFNVIFKNSKDAHITITSRPHGAKIELGYATLEEPDIILDFDQLSKMISKNVYRKAEPLSFYILNKKTGQRERIIHEIDWNKAPKYDDKVRAIRGIQVDLTDIIKKIGG